MELLKFLTAGNVDDGKSTLIGRLLYDSKAVSSDILESIEKSSKQKGNGTIDLSLLTDGLRAEREQGITIDVAYKYFNTNKRKFIIADAPGHAQYTRNMITAASNAQLIIILIDARHGITEQTRRHTHIAGLLGIPKTVLAINKIDAINYDFEQYQLIASEFKSLAIESNLKDFTTIPLSALEGDNVVHQSINTPWYEGPTLIEYLENVKIDSINNDQDLRFNVQYIIRPNQDFRGYAGTINSGSVNTSDEVLILPAGHISKIKSILIDGEPVNTAQAGQAVVIELEDDLDISRGASFISLNNTTNKEQEFEATLTWLDNQALIPGSRYILQHQTQRTPVIIKEILQEIDIQTAELKQNPNKIQLNGIARVRIKSSQSIAFDNFKVNASNGVGILINENTNSTSAGVIFNKNI